MLFVERSHAFRCPQDDFPVSPIHAETRLAMLDCHRARGLRATLEVCAIHAILEKRKSLFPRILAFLVVLTRSKSLVRIQRHTLDLRGTRSLHAVCAPFGVGKADLNLVTTASAQCRSVGDCSGRQSDPW